MKCLTSVLLFFFISFLATPTVVMLIEKNADVSCFYNFTEEEHQKENKEIKDFKADFTFKKQYELVAFNTNVSKKYISENCTKHDAISEEIFIPPPELV